MQVYPFEEDFWRRRNTGSFLLTYARMWCLNAGQVGQGLENTIRTFEMTSFFFFPRQAPEKKKKGLSLCVEPWACLGDFVFLEERGVFGCGPEGSSGSNRRSRQQCQ